MAAKKPKVKPKSVAGLPKLKKLGRPSLYNAKIAAKICKAISTSSYGIPRLCKMYDEFPNQDTVFCWLATHEDFTENYLLAKAKQAHVLSEQMIGISEDNQGENDSTVKVLRDKFKFETRRWQMGRLAPKIYGDKSENYLLEKNKEMDSELVKLRVALRKKNKKDY